MTDKEIVIGIIAGVKDAYKQLFIQYYSVIYKFLRKFVADQEQAEDIAQNIFLKVWINRDRLDPEKSIKSYLYVLAKNEALNHIKHESRSCEASVLELMPDSGTSDQRAEYFELRTALENRIHMMPPQRQLIFRMSRYSQFSDKEIAEKLGISVRTVQKHLELARKDIETIKPA